MCRVEVTMSDHTMMQVLDGSTASFLEREW